MRTHLEFVSTAFPPLPEEANSVNPGRYGKLVAAHLATELPQYGFTPTGMTPEDWGWRVDLDNKSFPLWIGCGNYEEYDNGFLCFIAPSRPFVRRFLRTISTVDTIERLAEAMQAIFERSGRVQQLRWWTEDESPISN